MKMDKPAQPLYKELRLRLDGLDEHDKQAFQKAAERAGVSLSVWISSRLWKAAIEEQIEELGHHY
jgi:predicted HicB family RNase H-like nuclease